MGFIDDEDPSPEIGNLVKGIVGTDDKVLSISRLNLSCVTLAGENEATSTASGLLSKVDGRHSDDHALLLLFGQFNEEGCFSRAGRSADGQTVVIVDKATECLLLISDIMFDDQVIGGNLYGERVGV